LAVAAATGALVAASPALAATNSTKVTWPNAIKVQAGPATKNHLFIGYGWLSEKGWSNGPVANTEGLWTHGIEDSVPVTTVERHDGPSCFLPSPENQLPDGTVHCPDGTAVEEFYGTGEDFRVFLGDHGDWFSVQDQPAPEGGLPDPGTKGSIGEFEVHAGPGNDEVYGNTNPAYVGDSEEEAGLEYWTQDDLDGDSGNDLLVGGYGADTLDGGPGADTLDGGAEAIEDAFYTGRDDTLLGGPGNDRLDAWGADRDHTINCGPGKKDKVIVDRRLDPKPKGCEFVKKRAPADILDRARRG
jgi:Ca2+-binding RTX toxin-like protein